MVWAKSWNNFQVVHFFVQLVGEEIVSERGLQTDR
jgi:hypothetical protein